MVTMITMATEVVFKWFSFIHIVGGDDDGWMIVNQEVRQRSRSVISFLRGITIIALADIVKMMTMLKSLSKWEIICYQLKSQGCK